MLELYHDWDAFCCIKVRFCLAEKGVEWHGHQVDLQKMEQLKPEYLGINPKGVIPTIVHDRRIVTESSVINEYIDEVFPGPSLVPAEPHERANMRIWVKFEEDVLHPSVRGPTYELMLRQALAKMPAALVDERLQYATSAEQAVRLRRAATAGAPANLAEVEAAVATMRRALNVMEARLQQVPWFGGREFSLADIAIAPWIDRLEELNFAQLWSGKAAVEDWVRRIKARKGFQAAIPKADQRIPAPLPHQVRIT
jgi:glutathione S-transferase